MRQEYGILRVRELANFKPGCLMAMGRFNRPSIMVYGGAIMPGHTTLLDPPKVINVSTTFEAYGQMLQGEMDEKGYQDIVRHACPGAGACGGLYTASTSIHPYVFNIDESGIGC
jgi:dihydroxy-acid dehydratase